MNVIVCLDDRGGMMFNGRRQSRDRRVYEDIVNDIAAAGRLLMAEYSKSLFTDLKVSVLCSDDFLDMASDGDICFVEDRALLPYVDKIEKITVYKWNRHYPSDMQLDIIPGTFELKLAEKRDFAGSSHERITKEIYRK